MIIDAFYDSYFEDLANRAPLISKGEGNFARISDMGDDKALAIVKNDLQYPCLILNDFDEIGKYGGVNDTQLFLSGSFAVLRSEDPDNGYRARTAAINQCRAAARSIWAKMIRDNLTRPGNKLYDNNITLTLNYTGNYIYPLGIPGYRIEFEWKVTGKLITIVDSEWQLP